MGFTAKAPRECRVELLGTTSSDAVKHRLAMVVDPRSRATVDHEFCIGDEALDVFAWIACQYFKSWRTPAG